MKNKYPRFLSVLCALMIATSASWAERVSQEDAALVAGNFMSAGDTTSQGAQVPGRNRPIRRVTLAEDAQYYVYANANGEGWVMVAANDVAHPILAYSDEGHFRTDNQPANLKSWLGGYSKQIKYAEDNHLEASEEIKAEWQTLRKGVRKAKQAVVVSPLLTTLWDQGEPYYNQCPLDGSKRSVTGCVATAMAQVMYYWKWPEKGTGSYSYTSETKSLSCSANFGNTTYDWDNMLTKYKYYVKEGDEYATSTSAGTSTQQNAVAALMMNCGVAAEMDYTSDVSGAFTVYPNASLTDSRCAAYALIHNFGYKSSTLKCYMRSGGYGYSAVNDNTWHNLLKTELDAARPILYAGSGSGGGHSFVCDGYDSGTGSDRKYHFNWGWSGACNGYYTVDALIPGTGGIGSGSDGVYNDDQDIIIGIIPDKTEVTITWSVNGVTSTTTQTTGTLVLPTDPSDCSGAGGKKFVGWTESNSVSGSKPSDLFTSGSGITVTSNKKYYAVYATASGSGSDSWDLCAELASVTEGVYVITWNNSYYLPSETTATSNPSVGSGITQSNDALTNTVSSAMQWTFTGDNTNGFTVSHTSGNTTYYLASTNAAQGISVSTSSTTSKWKASIDNTYGMLLRGSDGGTRNLAVYNSGSWRYYATGNSYTGTLRLYKKTSGSSYSDYSLTCGAACSQTPIMSFTNATVNKTTADASYKQTVNITGKGSGQTVAYSSSNTSVGTVASDGTVTLKGVVGQTTITASVEANGTYCAASASYTLNVAAVVCSLSGISLNTTSVQKTFVTGATLDYTGLVVTASYSNCSSKTVNPTTVTVSPSMATTGEKTVTVSYTENSVTRTATYSITVVAPYTVTYNACGDVFATQQYAPGATLVLPENPGGYDGLTFAGWTATEHHTGASAPADLFSTAGSKTVTADITYYAVFH